MPPKWILGCQQLVELYYGVRMIAQVKESAFFLDAGSTSIILQPDPRRIRYEIAFSSLNVTTTSFIWLGTPQAMDTNSAELVQAVNGTALAPVSGFTRIQRNFLSDLDTVTLPQAVRSSNFECDVTVRETFLTPLPTDEASPITAPLG